MGSHFIDAFGIALGQAAGRKWYVSTMELQLTSCQFCLACRGVRTLCVAVNTQMPHSLWGDDVLPGMMVRREPYKQRQRPSVRAAGAKWQLPADMLVSVLSQSILLGGVEKMTVEDKGLIKRHGKAWYGAIMTCLDMNTTNGSESFTANMPSPKRFSISCIVCPTFGQASQSCRR